MMTLRRYRVDMPSISWMLVMLDLVDAEKLAERQRRVAPVWRKGDLCLAQLKVLTGLRGALACIHQTATYSADIRLALSLIEDVKEILVKALEEGK